MGKFILNFYDVMIGMTFFVYFTELIGPFLLFTPIFFNKIRIGACFAFFAVLIGMALSMRLGHFPFIGMAAFILFLPTAFLSGRLVGILVPAGMNRKPLLNKGP